MRIKSPKCHSDNPSDSKFCKECGAKFSPSEHFSDSHIENFETSKEEVVNALKKTKIPRTKYLEPYWEIT